MSRPFVWESGGRLACMFPTSCAPLFFPTTRFFFSMIYVREASNLLIPNTLFLKRPYYFCLFTFASKFPYVTSKLAEFLQRNWASEEMKSAVEALRVQVRKEAKQNAADSTPGDLLSMHRPLTYPACIPCYFIDRLPKMLQTVSPMPPQLPQSLLRCKFDSNRSRYTLY